MSEDKDFRIWCYHCRFTQRIVGLAENEAVTRFEEDGWTFKEGPKRAICQRCRDKEPKT